MKQSIILGLAAATVAAAASYFPLAAGNTWTYRSAQTGEQFTIRVGSPVAMQSGYVYHYVTGYAPARLLVRLDGERMVFLDEESGLDRQLAVFRPREGDWWESAGRECLQEGQTPERNAGYEGPAGRWTDVIEVRYRTIGCADTGVELEQFASNIGMLRRTVTTIAGPRTFDLVQAKIGSQTIETGLRGGFSITLNEDAAARNWQMVLRLESGSGAPLRLTFPTAQEFDAVLRDAKGSIVWQWSEGLAFAQAEHRRDVSSSWEAGRATIPFPAGGDGPYTLEAWLTTDSRGPKFGAAVPVALPVLK